MTIKTAAAVLLVLSVVAFSIGALRPSFAKIEWTNLGLALAIAAAALLTP